MNGKDPKGSGAVYKGLDCPCDASWWFTLGTNESLGSMDMENGNLTNGLVVRLFTLVSVDHIPCHRPTIRYTRSLRSVATLGRNVQDHRRETRPPVGQDVRRV